LALAVPVLLGCSVLVFLLIHFAPGDPITSLIGVYPSVDQVAIMRHQLGLDQPLPIQYLLWLGRVLHGDLGTSLLTHTSVASSILQRLPTTLLLTAMSMAWALLIGITLGIASGFRRGGFIDTVSRVLSIIGISVPPFLAGIILILIFSVQLNLFPPGGSLDQYGLLALVLPSLALGIEYAAVVLRFTRASILEVLEQGYIRTARAKGLTPRAVEYRHAFGNALLPVLTVVGLRTGTLLSGALVTENVFSLPGLGTLLTGAIGLRDYPLVLGTTLVMAFMVVAVNLAVDLAYGLIDPRIKL